MRVKSAPTRAAARSTSPGRSPGSARCQFLGRVGDDVFGRRLRAALQDAGVTLAVPAATPAPTTLALAEVDSGRGGGGLPLLPRGDLRRRNWTPGDVPPGVLASTRRDRPRGPGPARRADGLHPGHAADRRAPATTVLLDPNCRPHAIAELPRSGPPSTASSTRTDVVKVSVDDLRLLDPGGWRAAARRLLARPPRGVLVTDGPAGHRSHRGR